MPFPLKKVCRFLASETANPRHVFCPPQTVVDIFMLRYAMLPAVVPQLLNDCLVLELLRPSHTCNNHFSGGLSLMYTKIFTASHAREKHVTSHQNIGPRVTQPLTPDYQR